MVAIGSFLSKEAAVAFEEECHQEAEKLKAAGEDWSHYRYIPRKQLTIQAKPDAAMPVLRDVRKEELINDWNDTEVGEESEMEAAVKQEAWFDEQTEIPREEYDSYDYQLTDTEEYRIFLPHRAPILIQNSKMSSLVRARSLLSKLNTRLARGLASNHYGSSDQS